MNGILRKEKWVERGVGIFEQPCILRCIRQCVTKNKKNNQLGEKVDQTTFDEKAHSVASGALSDELKENQEVHETHGKICK